GRRHWPSDVVGSAALALGYGLVAMLHPDLRWRMGVGVAALLGIGLVRAAYTHGITVAIPASTVASRRPPLEQIDFGSAYQGGHTQPRPLPPTLTRPAACSVRGPWMNGILNARPPGFWQRRASWRSGVAIRQ